MMAGMSRLIRLRRLAGVPSAVIGLLLLLYVVPSFAAPPLILTEVLWQSG